MSKQPPIILRDETLRRRVIGMIERLDLSKGWEIRIEPHRRKRSISQLRLMWAWLHDVAEAVRQHTGMDADDVHEFMKQKFLKPRLIELGGQVVERRSTSDLTTAEMSEYMDAIYAFVTSELGILLPLPEEYTGRAAA